MLSTDQAVFYRFRGRLALFRRLAGQRDYWEDKWQERNIVEWLAAYRGGKLGEFERVFLQYLPRDLPTLEAGCGCGHLVSALAAHGYDVEGVDYAARTVARVRAAAPELNVRVGDVHRLDAPDETYGGYISIGVFEHNPDGPMAGLVEARRVLHRRGVALISVPYLNECRKRTLHCAPVRERPNGEDLAFYQYYFAADDFDTLLAAAGFRVLEHYPYSVYGGVARDTVAGRWLDRTHFGHWRVRQQVTRWCAAAPPWARARWSHMLMCICVVEP